jgi:hypothetical protein
VGFLAGSVVHRVASPWVQRRTLPTVQVRPAMASVEEVHPESVVHESVAKTKEKTT